MGHLILTFDDSYDSHRAFVAPLLRANNMVGGFAMIPGLHTSNTGGSRLTVQRAREIQDVYGMECYTHACTSQDHDNTGLFTATDGYQGAENSILKAKRLMIAQGFDRSHAEVFVAPPGMPSYGDPTDGLPANVILSRHFVGRRTFMGGFPSNTVAGVETVTPQNVFKIRTCGWNGSTVAQVRDAISRARLNPYAVVVVVFHDITSSASTGVFTSQTDFTAVVTEAVFQRDNSYQSDQSSGTAGGKLVVSSLSALMRGQLAPTL